MSKLSKGELKDRDARKGLVQQREKLTSSKVRPVLLEYFVEDYQAAFNFWEPKVGWQRYGRYKSREQALRVIESVKKARRLGQYTARIVPMGSKWRIDGVEIADPT